MKKRKPLESAQKSLEGQPQRTARALDAGQAIPVNFVVRNPEILCPLEMIAWGRDVVAASSLQIAAGIEGESRHRWGRKSRGTPGRVRVKRAKGRAGGIRWKTAKN